MFTCSSLLKGYIIKIDPVCSARCEKCLGFIGIKIYQPQFCPVAYSATVNIKNLSCRVREVNYDVKGSIIGKQADI